MKAGMESVSPLAHAITDFAVSADIRFPSGARHIMKLSLLDWSAVGLAGRDEPVSLIVRAMIAEEAGRPEATVFGLAEKCPARAAALANGTTSHALDYDDTHFVHIGHPSVAIIPAALAIAEKTGASGAAFLDAALIGVEASCRIGAWLGRRHYEHGFHQTATSGSFGAALAASRLLGLDKKQILHALGLASTRASGLKSQFGTMGKPFHAGMAAANGVEAALLAKAGFVSQPDGLECEQGFSRTHAGEGGDLAPILKGLGETFWLESVQHKFHACCHGTHAALEAFGEARLRHNLVPEDIEAVVVMVHPRWLKVCNIERPATGLEAKFSYRLTSAMALLGYDTGALATFSAALCADSPLVALRDRVSVETDPAMADTEAAITIRRRSGEVVHIRHDLDQPLPAIVRENKVRAKAGSLIGVKRAAELWQAIDAIDEGPVWSFSRLLTR